MEVTTKNFDDVLERFPELLKRAQFIAIDTEFTGLRVDGGGTFNYFDTLKELYEVDRQIASTFLVVQYGICVFEYHPESNKYTHHAFNFYVFPSSSSKNFTCQVSCIKFLGDHGMDFNKLFRDGIPYLTEDDLEAKLENLKTRQEKQVSESPNIKVPKDQKQVLDRAISKIKDFIQSNEEESTLPRYNSFLRRLIYQTAREKFGGRVELETGSDGIMRMTKGITAEEKQRREEQKWDGEKKQILHEVGFSKIIKLLVQNGKPIIGHNVFLDILFTIQQFLHPLPSDYEEFRDMTHCLFPRILDTKHVATAGHFKDFAESTLEAVLDGFDSTEIPLVEPAVPGEGYTKGESHPHEAAYDAYITGLSFLAMIGRIGKENTTNIYKQLLTSPLLTPFMNKLSTPRLHEIAHLDLEGSYVPPNRQNVFHIDFPEAWKKEDVLDHFKEYGFITIRWIDTTSAFISIGSEFAKKFKKTMLNSKESECTVMAYSEFRREINTKKPEVSEHKDSRKRYSSEDFGEVVSQKRNCNFAIPDFE